MYFVALAADYEGTLAEDGRVAEEAIAALRSFRQSGRMLILVTGRELPDLRRAFLHLDLFDATVAENGAVLVAAFLCDIRDDAEGGHRRLRRFHVAGCHSDRTIALGRALTEAAQIRLTYIAGIRDDLLPRNTKSRRPPTSSTRCSTPLSGRVSLIPSTRSQLLPRTIWGRISAGNWNACAQRGSAAGSPPT